MKRTLIMLSLVAMFTFFGSSIKVSASSELEYTVNTTYGDITVSNYGYQYVICEVERDSGYIKLYVSNSPMTCTFLGDYSGRQLYQSSTPEKSFMINPSNGNITETEFSPYSFYTDTVKCNYDIKSGDTVIVAENFPKVVLPILPTAIRGETLKQVMSQVLGLVPLVIGFLVLVIAFYKAWMFLEQQLRKA